MKLSTTFAERANIYIAQMGERRKSRIESTRLYTEADEAMWHGITVRSLKCGATTISAADCLKSFREAWLPESSYLAAENLADRIDRHELTRMKSYAQFVIESLTTAIQAQTQEGRVNETLF